jgi:hypothetical protein
MSISKESGFKICDICDWTIQDTSYFSNGKIDVHKSSHGIYKQANKTKYGKKVSCLEIIEDETILDSLKEVFVNRIKSKDKRCNDTRSCREIQRDRIQARVKGRPEFKNRFFLE